MDAAAKRPNVTRGLRFRLTLSYVVFFTLLLVGVGVVFRQMLASILDSQVDALLLEEWGAVKGYLRIEQREPVWYFDREDPEEAFIVERLRRIYLLADDEGRVLEVSEIYRTLGVDSPTEIKAVLRSSDSVIKHRRNEQGLPYMVRQGVLIDAGQRYFVSVGRSLAENQGVVAKFTRNYFALLPLMILSISLLGWFAAGRALRPVTDLAATAQAISSANLGLRIPQRGASDELDHLIATFNNMVGRLENSFVLTRQFSTDVSHELRTPLTAIRGQLEVALFAARTVEEHREAIINALQDVERLSQIVRALLHLSQAESGQLALQKSKLDVVPLLRDIVEQFQIPAEAGRVGLSADLPEQCWLDADRIQMERLVTNLLSNAVKFTPPDGAVRVHLSQTQGWAELAVEDSGQGIAADHLPHIFDRFYRVPAAADGREKGLGLGLSFVAWIVKAHEGRIDVESAVGKGSCFRVSLRTVAPDAAPAPEKESVNDRDAVL